MAHLERFQNASIMHESVPDEYKPILLEAGVRVAFPAPTVDIPAPRCPIEKKGPQTSGRARRARARRA